MIGDFLGRILSHVVWDALDAGASAVFSAFRKPRTKVEPGTPIREASPLGMAAAQTNYVRWAETKGLVDAGRELRGVIAGAPVSLRTGLAGSSPSAVEILLTIPSEVPEPVLVVAGPDVPGELAPLFARLGRELASIGCTATTLRLRLAPLTPVETLDAAWQELEDLVRARPVRSAYRDG